MEAFLGLSASSAAILFFMIFLAGFVDASAGGGGIISLPAYIFTGMPAHCALGCNKLSSSAGTTIAVLKFWRNGAVDFRAAIIAAAGSFIGSGLGARLALMLSDHVIKTMLLIILPCAAVIILTKRNLGDVDRSGEVTGLKADILAALIGFFIGGYDGLFGPGTGTFAIIAFSALMGYDLRTASGNAKLLNLASNYASLITFALAGTIIYRIAVPAAVCGIAGNFLGAHFALTKGAKFIRPMLVTVIVLILIKLLFEILTK